MRIHRAATAGIAGLAAAALLTVGAGAVSAATTTAESCPGTGPAASLSTEDHDAFLKEMTKLKADRDAIMRSFGKTAPLSGQGQAAGQRSRGAGRGTSATMTSTQRAEMRTALAKWRVTRDALFAQYDITARSQGRNA